MNEIPLALQTAYADLLDRCSQGAFAEDFPEDGTFIPKTIKGRRYWYFQVTDADGARKQRYVGVETPDLLTRIEHHREIRGDRKDRRKIVSMLVRSAHLPRPVAEIGNVVEALAAAGVFRLSAVLVGTVAYQTYSGLLGIRLTDRTLQTGDIDLAQAKNASLAVEEPAPPIMDALRKVDPSFRPVPHLRNPLTVTSYAAKGGIRVEFLTPNEGPDTDAPAALSALGIAAQQHRFLDFLIREPEGAVLLHGDGVYVQVPSPQRYAIHKLIVARRRREGVKVGKDLAQAEALLQALVKKRPHELKAAWREAFDRGKKWRQLMGEGLGLLSPDIRDITLRTVGQYRSVIPGLDLTFNAPAGRYDSDRDVMEFAGEAAGQTIRCAISREALEDHFGADDADNAGRLKLFREHRTAIEKLAKHKYLNFPIEKPDQLLITSANVDELRARPSRRQGAKVKSVR